MKISPDGKHLAFTYEDEDQVKLGVMNMKTKKGVYSFSMGPNREAAQFWWVNNKRLMIQSQRITGWLDGQQPYPELFTVNYDGKKRELMWDFQRAYIRPVSLLDDDPDHVLVTKHHFTDNFSGKLQRLNINNGKMNYMEDTPKMKGGSKSRITFIGVDNNDVPKLAVERDPMDEDDFYDDVSYLHYKNQQGEWAHLSLPKIRKDRPTLSPHGFSLDNNKFFFSSNHDLDHNGNTGFFEFDFKTNEIKLLFRHPDVDIAGTIYGKDGEVIGATYEPGYPEYYYIEDEVAQPEITLHKQLRSSFKGQEVRVGSYTKNKKMTTLYVYSDQNPGTFYLFDRSNNNVEFISKRMPDIEPSQMAKVEPFTLEARDGLKMYGQMTIPPGKELKNLPLIIYPHGGPYGAIDTWGWESRPQLFASRGYLVLQLNYRGSGGYGEDFQEAGHTEWGAKMQDDLTDATLWAINQGYADKDRVCIHGVSYGGYAAMHAVVHEPDLYKCSIPDAGIYEVELQWKKADSFKGNPKARKKYFDIMFGTHEDEAVLNARSPAMNADKVKAALLLVHGTEDVRVPIDNAYFLEEKLQEAGKPYDKIYKKDGHGFQKIPYRIELYEKMLAFLDEHIGQ
ncbi:S9 family peptidase [Marinicella meishanensis]|uniref:S9 family peptidase n=1 Tax=Marinicella meishanensis TaxID=2873263 RepID=UPI001CBB42CC|nr:prolyl oligopeptidase family serine peptidase [Marinicella sp. NBU2979]